MVEFESCGIPTRFPHNSHLYKLLLSKDWMKHMCLMPRFNAPATTNAPRAVVAADKMHAADLVMKSMRNLQLVQHQHPGCPKKPIWDIKNDKIKGFYPILTPFQPHFNPILTPF